MDNKENGIGKKVIENDIFFQEVQVFLASGKDVMFHIKGNSMLPFLSHGDKVLLSAITADDLKLGRIVLARSDWGYVLHRLVWKRGNYVWLAGDNNLVQVEKVERTNILGYVKYAEGVKGKVDVNSNGQVFMGICWFLLRPLRWLIFKIRKIF